MRIFFNGASLSKGGGVQRAVAFLHEVVCDAARKNSWCCVLPEAMLPELARAGLPRDFAEILPFTERPARRRAARMAVQKIAGEFQPDCVFTFGGPAYVRFSAPHLMFFAVAWVTHGTLKSMRMGLTTVHDRAAMLGSALYKAVWVRRANYWTVETETARRGLHTRCRIPLDRIEVVANTCAEPYRQQAASVPPPPGNAKLRILSFSAAYAHKRLDLIPKVARILVEMGVARDFEFVITLPPQEPLAQRIAKEAAALGVERHVVNYGPVLAADGPALYRTCHIAFLPTVLETFSASYPEAMAMGLPIVTSDLDFARDICGDAALYFRAADPYDAAQKIAQLVDSPDLWKQLVTYGKRVLDRFPTPRQQYEAYMAILERIARR